MLRRVQPDLFDKIMSLGGHPASLFVSTNPGMKWCKMILFSERSDTVGPAMVLVPTSTADSQPEATYVLLISPHGDIPRALRLMGWDTESDIDEETTKEKIGLSAPKLDDQQEQVRQAVGRIGRLLEQCPIVCGSVQFYGKVGDALDSAPDMFMMRLDLDSEVKVGMIFADADDYEDVLLWIIPGDSSLKSAIPMRDGDWAPMPPLRGKEVTSLIEMFATVHQTLKG
jgi:hypothetical protein